MPLHKHRRSGPITTPGALYQRFVRILNIVQGLRASISLFARAVVFFLFSARIFTNLNDDVPYGLCQGAHLRSTRRRRLHQAFQNAPALN